MKICWSFATVPAVTMAKLVLYRWAIIRDFSDVGSFGGSEGENKTLRVCSFCSKNHIEQKSLVQYHICGIMWSAGRVQRVNSCAISCSFSHIFCKHML